MFTKKTKSTKNDSDLQISDEIMAENYDVGREFVGRTLRIINWVVVVVLIVHYFELVDIFEMLETIGLSGLVNFLEDFK